MGTVDGCKWEGVKSGLASGLKEVAGHPLAGQPGAGVEGLTSSLGGNGLVFCSVFCVCP